jgi:hypothetical protein
MAYTIIPDLPQGGRECEIPVDVKENLLVLEQDITRKITPLSFLSNSIAQLNLTTNIKGSDLIPLSDVGAVDTRNLTIDNLMYYINTHLNVIDEVFFVSNLSGVDSLDFAERGRNEQLPFRTIKFAAQQISRLIAADANYNAADPNYVQDLAFPKKTPEENSKSIRKQYTIMVRSGDYVEDNPVYLPPNTSMIGDNLRRTTIRPKNTDKDIFWVDSANYIWGFTFRDHKAPAAAVAFPISTTVKAKADDGKNVLGQYAPDRQWVIDSYNNAYLKPLKDDTFGSESQAIVSTVIPNNRPFIYCSPYIQGCTSYAVSTRMPNNDVGDNTNNVLYPETWFSDEGVPLNPGSPDGGVDGIPPPNDAGMGMRIDGSLVNGYFRSMVLDSFTQVNQGGKGVYILNHGYAQLVSIFTVATEQGIVCEAGGTCSISTSNSTFGLSGLVATGMSYKEVLSGSFVIPNTLAYPIPSQSFADGNTYGVYGYSIGSNLFTVNGCKPMPAIYPDDDVSDILAQGAGAMTVASQPYATLCFTVGDDKPWISGYDGGVPQWSGPGYMMEEDMNPTLKRLQGEFSQFDGYNASLSATPMHQVKLFFIEQGVPVPSLSGGKTNKNTTVYNTYNTYKLSIPPNPIVEPNIGLPWDINLSFNLSLDFQNHSVIDAYDSFGNPLHFYIDYKGKPQQIDYKYYDTVGGVYYDIPRNSSAQNTFRTNLLNKNVKNQTIDFTNAPVKFYARSLIETGSHTFEYMGVGTRMKYAIPAFGGVANNESECASDGFNDKYNNAPGTVFFTSSNELGDFKVGKDFTIVQSTGTIRGDTFSRAILTLVTPLTIVLE